MNLHTPRVLAALPLLLPGTPLSALQDPAPPAFDEVLRRTIVVEETEEGALIGASRWSADVVADGVEVRGPACAGHLALSPVSVGRAGWSLDLSHAGLERSGDGLARRVAPGITERMDLRSEGLELSYVFDEPPPGAGDLVVHIDVSSDLRAEAGVFGDEGLSFSGEAGELHVGAVLGIDARGATAPGELRWDGRRLTLALDAAFVDGAAYPLVLDPVVGPVTTLPVSTANDSTPDLAYDSPSGTWAFVWNRQVSANKHIAAMQRTLFDGTPVGPPILLGKEVVETRPVVASCAGAGRFVFAHLSGASPGGPAWEVAVGSVRASDGHHKRTRTILLPATSSISSVDIGGDEGGLALLAFSVDPGDVDTRIVEVTTAGWISQISEMVVHSGSSYYGFGHEARVSNTNGAAGRWCVAWEVEDRGSDPELLAMAIVDRDGTPVIEPRDIQFDPEWSYRDVSCATDGDQFLVSFVRDSSTPDEVWVERYAVFGTTLYFTGRRHVTTASSAGSVSGTAIDDARTGVAVAWRERSGGVDRIVATSLEPVALGICEPLSTVHKGALGPPRLFAMSSSGALGEPGGARLVWSGTPAFGPAGVHTVLWQVCP